MYICSENQLRPLHNYRVKTREDISMDEIKTLFESIDHHGFDENTLQQINKLVNDIENGRTNFSRFTIPEHAGLCSAGAPLIGASIIASYARASLEASCNAGISQGGCPTNWQID